MFGMESDRLHFLAADQSRVTFWSLDRQTQLNKQSRFDNLGRNTGTDRLPRYLLIHDVAEGGRGWQRQDALDAFRCSSY